MFRNHCRKNNRLANYDYTRSGYYFITICTQNRINYFGKIEDNTIQLNCVGNMVDLWWKKMFEKYNNISMDQYIIMPNHIHGIIHINVGANPCICPIKNRGENMVSPLRRSNQYLGLGRCVSWFKRMTTNEYINNVEIQGWESFNRRIWQRNYYDHIIRNEKYLNKIRQYITNNPSTWPEDAENIQS
jgi:REP element-mobilizing transposase RayT